jgi:hypothetical protein
VHGRELRRRPGLFDANFTDGRYGNARPLVESDAAARYDAFLAGAPATKLAD